MAGQRIILIGARGSGKSTVGRLLAAHVGMRFVDADDELEARQGRTIREIFAVAGEAHFRILEAQLLTELLSGGPMVLATGGGAVLQTVNRERFRAAGFVVWLSGSAESLWTRIQSDPATVERRPNLGGGGLTEIAETLTQRELLYQECADLTVATDHRTPAEITTEIVRAWQNSSS